MAELLPRRARDVVTGHFANIRARCPEDGRDILDEPIPVTPTQHYFMGGVWVDKDGCTSMPSSTPRARRFATVFTARTA